jgi:hypothetical protein
VIKPGKSHYYVRDKMLNADRPKDWTTPVDYRNGCPVVASRTMTFAVRYGYKQPVGSMQKAAKMGNLVIQDSVNEPVCGVRCCW